MAWFQRFLVAETKWYFGVDQRYLGVGMLAASLAWLAWVAYGVMKAVVKTFLL